MGEPEGGLDHRPSTALAWTIDQRRTTNDKKFLIFNSFLAYVLSEITLYGEIVCSVQRHAINNHF